MPGDALAKLATTSSQIEEACKSLTVAMGDSGANVEPGSKLALAPVWLLLVYVLYTIFRWAARLAVTTGHLLLGSSIVRANEESGKTIADQLRRAQADPGPLPSALLDILHKWGGRP